MLCYAALRRAVLRCAVMCSCVVLCCAALRCAVLRRAVMCSCVLCWALLRCAVLCCAALRDAVQLEKEKGQGGRRGESRGCDTRG
eukprot:5297449-Pyramimonas_sp.AAC.1